MLLGRDHERHEIEHALARARSGTSATLALAGEPGTGKRRCSRHAAGRAAGMRLLRARGIESEAQIPFGSLLELIRPALMMSNNRPEPQAVALEGALALRPGAAQERFAVGAATLSILAAYAEQAPVAVLLDDAQWLDSSSVRRCCSPSADWWPTRSLSLSPSARGSRHCSTAPTCRRCRSAA